MTTVPTAGARDRVAAAFDAIDAAARPEVWITLADREKAVARAEALDECISRGPVLAGLTVAVKDNVDVAGLPTTAACPAYAYAPADDAAVVAALRRAGATILGKTNLDQFATGLVGTRSPYGAVRDARRPQFISGGSSSGSAVAVALGLADLALGTDTAGSGRVPAAFGGVLGIKPTQALLSRAGVVAACRSFDCVSLFARELDVAELALAVLWAGGDDRWPVSAPLRAPSTPRIALPAAAGLESLSAESSEAFATAARRLEAGGAELAEIDLAPLLAAGALLYGGAFVAERYAAVGAFITAHPDDVDPAVAEIIGGAATVSAYDYLADWERLRALRLEAARALDGFDALLAPTVPRQPTVAEVAASPIEVNQELGAFTTFCNLLELCAVALPAGAADGGQFGVTLMAPAFHDRVLLDLSARFLGRGGHRSSGALPVGGGRPGPPATELLVVGAHLSGQPLNGQLVAAGGRLMAPARTAAQYRLYRLDTEPPKPGLVRAGDNDRAAAAISGELWELPPAALAALLAALPPPMVLGPVELDDGRAVTGFLCEPAALAGAREITAHGGWRAYLQTATTP